MRTWDDTPATLEAYAKGIRAGHRIEEYADAQGTVACPYLKDSQEASAWWDGLGDGTEDFIAYQLAD